MEKEKLFFLFSFFYLDRRAKISFLWPVRVSSNLSRKEWECVKGWFAISSEVRHCNKRKKKPKKNWLELYATSHHKKDKA